MCIRSPGKSGEKKHPWRAVSTHKKKGARSLLHHGACSREKRDIPTHQLRTRLPSAKEGGALRTSCAKGRGGSAGNAQEQVPLRHAPRGRREKKEGEQTSIKSEKKGFTISLEGRKKKEVSPLH